MKLKKILIITLISILGIFILAGAGFYLKFPKLFNCLMIDDSDEFKEVRHNIYISKDTPAEVKDSILLVLEETDKRICTFWNTDKKIKDPVIIFCYSKSLLSKYGGNNLIVTYKTPLNSFIVFCKERINPDILSHELFHAEFCSRIGYFNNTTIPTWFDEGMAMQVDYRKEYSEEKFSELNDSLEMNIKLPEISTPEKFYSANRYYHFLHARHEVNSWFGIVKKKGVNDLINRIKNGEQFHFVYEELKATGGL
jgi:hypothetical protein